MSTNTAGAFDEQHTDEPRVVMSRERGDLVPAVPSGPRRRHRGAEGEGSTKGSTTLDTMNALAAKTVSTVSVVVVMKVLGSVSSSLAPYIAGSIFSKIFVDAVMSNSPPPSLVTMVTIAYTLDIVFTTALSLVVMFILRESAVSSFNMPKGDLLKVVLADVVSSRMHGMFIAAHHASIVENQKYFRYREDGLRAVYAMESMLWATMLSTNFVVSSMGVAMVGDVIRLGDGSQVFASGNVGADKIRTITSLQQGIISGFYTKVNDSIEAFDQEIRETTASLDTGVSQAIYTGVSSMYGNVVKTTKGKMTQISNRIAKLEDGIRPDGVVVAMNAALDKDILNDGTRTAIAAALNEKQILVGNIQAGQTVPLGTILAANNGLAQVVDTIIDTVKKNYSGNKMSAEGGMAKYGSAIEVGKAYYEVVSAQTVDSGAEGVPESALSTLFARRLPSAGWSLDNLELNATRPMVDSLTRSVQRIAVMKQQVGVLTQSLGIEHLRDPVKFSERILSSGL